MHRDAIFRGESTRGERGRQEIIPIRIKFAASRCLLSRPAISAAPPPKVIDRVGGGESQARLHGKGKLPSTERGRAGMSGSESDENFRFSNSGERCRASDHRWSAHPSTYPNIRISDSRTVKVLVACKRYTWYSSIRSMKTCMNIAAAIWPVVTVAQATRHERSGSMFGQGLSFGQKSYYPNLDRPLVGR
jgi:hypothetical protein